MKSKRMRSDKMNKEQSADDPPWIWFVKNMLNSTISMSYPDVVIAQSADI